MNSDHAVTSLKAEAKPPEPNPQIITVTKKDDTGEPPIPGTLSIMPVRGMVIFPGTVVPLSVRRTASLKMLDETLPKSKIIGLFTQKKEEENAPGPDDLYHVGIAGSVLKLIRQADDVVVILVQALRRIRVSQFVQTEPYFRADVERIESVAPPDSAEWQARVKNLRDAAVQLLDLTPDVPEQARSMLMNIPDPGQLADFLASNLTIEIQHKQDLLEELDVSKRVNAVQQRLTAQLEIARLQQKLQQDVASQISDSQKRIYLREQIKAIQRELGEGEGGADEQIEDLRKRLEAAKPPETVMKQVEKELKRLNYIPPASPEYSVIVTYAETIADLPWSKLSEDKLDLNNAQRILDRDHFDLEKVKRRLIEYLAVRKLNPEGRGPILCFLGPPGVGKTSLGQSIADALGRKFARISLGGVRDEAEIRGHRRTYIGSMPGRLIAELRRVGTRNPVIMLDEIDKMAADFRGDPASALLEVLDPRQNHSFTDHFLDVPFDLSQVIFIATANYIDPVPAPLRDRMEVIEIPGYTEHQKLEIAKQYIVKRQLSEHGLKPAQCKWQPGAITKIINDYTHEAGVRDLERQIGAVCRAIAAQVAQAAPGEKEQVTVTPELVGEHLGPIRFFRESRLKTSAPGIVTGLAYTPVGGEVLHIEAARYAGKGQVTLTGQIGNVMKESVQAALSLVRSRAKELGINPEDFEKTDIHVHVPAGAIPKDGPSAGIAMFTAIASLFTNRPVRFDVAMTGEVTLRGLVLPIGGLKEKSLAAARAGIKTVIIPKLNEKDLPEIPDEVKKKVTFHPAEDVDQVLSIALEPQKNRVRDNGAPKGSYGTNGAPAKKRRSRGPGKLGKIKLAGLGNVIV
ncbi:MAG TPA: endopeptidase La [Verrucomicrobiae bacterium]|nr:endopeptidase La [Verrucomicrobiae bacterium]